jgi:hypothetical protein
MVVCSLCHHVFVAPLYNLGKTCGPYAVQEDGTLEAILAEEQVLRDMLEPICGTAGPKDEDSDVREALAEAIAELAETDAGRTRLWDLKVPEMLRKG